MNIPALLGFGAGVAVITAAIRDEHRSALAARQAAMRAAAPPPRRAQVAAVTREEGIPGRVPTFPGRRLYGPGGMHPLSVLDHNMVFMRHPWRK